MFLKSGFVLNKMQTVFFPAPDEALTDTNKIHAHAYVSEGKRTSDHKIFVSSWLSDLAQNS